MRNLLVSTLLVTLALPAGAQNKSECTFTAECFEGEACEETSFEVSVTADPENPQGLLMISDSETLKGSGLRTGDTARVVFFGESGMHAISVQKDAQARYTAHLDGPMVITYQGTCEVSN
jgi:hypothetical protein